MQKNYIYSEIFLGELNDYEIVNGKKCLSHLSKINIFVGANNSGKSRFMRELIREELWRFNIKGINMEEYNDTISLIAPELKTILEQYENILIVDTDAGALKLADYNIGSYLNKTLISDIGNIEILIAKFEELKKHANSSKFNPTSYRGSGSSGNLQAVLKNFLESKKGLIQQLEKFNISSPDFEIFYIPILRGLNYFKGYQSDLTDIFENRSRENYFLLPYNKEEKKRGKNLYRAAIL